MQSLGYCTAGQSVFASAGVLFAPPVTLHPALGARIYSKPCRSISRHLGQHRFDTDCEEKRGLEPNASRRSDSRDAEQLLTSARYFFCELWARLERVGYQTVIRDLEDRSLLVFVNRDDCFRVFHSRQVLYGPANGNSDI